MRLLNLAVGAAAASQIGPQVQFNAAPRNLTIQGNLVYGSGGTSVDVYVQTSLDGGLTWTDIANFHFTTSNARAIYNLSAATAKTTAVSPTDGSLASNTAVDGVLGPLYRCKYTTVGTYAGSTTMSVDIATDQAA